MKKALVMIDVQNDFVDGSLGSKEAQSIIEPIIEEIKKPYDSIYVTYDTHEKNYLDTFEGKHLPVEHCIKGSNGWQLNPQIQQALQSKPYITIEKPTFGSLALVQYLTSANYDEITLVGLCTDICVISNALLIRASLPNTKIIVKQDCCAGVTKEKHEAALQVMQSCQIDVM